MADLPSSAQSTTEEALGRYHGSKMNKLLYKPRQVTDPTIFYKQGGNLKTKNEVLFENSPQRPINLVDE